MPVYGKDGRQYRYCGICGEEPSREEKRPWSLNVHCLHKHGLTIFPGCSQCREPEVHCRQRPGDVIGHLQSKHGVKARAESLIVWMLVDIRDANPSNFHPKPHQLAIFPGRGDVPGEDVTALLAAAQRWRERQASRQPSTSGAGQHEDRSRRRRSPSPRPRVPDLASIHRARREGSPPTAKKQRAPEKESRRTKLTELDISISEEGSQGQPAPLASPTSAKRTTASKRVRESSRESVSSSSSGEVTTQAGSPSPRRISPVKAPPPSPQLLRQSPRKQPSPRKASVKTTPPHRSASPPQQREQTPPVPASIWRREAEQAALQIAVRNEQPWERAILPPQQLALQEELAALASVTPAEIQQFQRLLNHLCETRPGGARGLLRDSGLLPQPRPGTITQGADGTTIHLPEDVLDFSQLRRLFRVEEQQHAAEEESRGSKGGPGKKSKK